MDITDLFGASDGLRLFAINEADRRGVRVVCRRRSSRRRERVEGERVDIDRFWYGERERQGKGDQCTLESNLP